MDLLYNLLYNKSTTNRTSGVWAIGGLQPAGKRIKLLGTGQRLCTGMQKRAVGIASSIDSNHSDFGRIILNFSPDSAIPVGIAFIPLWYPVLLKYWSTSIATHISIVFWNCVSIYAVSVCEEVVHKYYLCRPSSLAETAQMDSQFHGKFVFKLSKCRQLQGGSTPT